MKHFGYFKKVQFIVILFAKDVERLVEMFNYLASPILQGVVLKMVKIKYFVRF